MSRRGVLFTVSGPSGVGKGTIVKQLLKRRENVLVSVSATTRKPRAGERDGIEYDFVTDAEFDDMIRRDELLEWANVHNHRYGTPKSSIEKQLAAGYDVILEIDVQGSKQVIQKNPGLVAIFVLPPDIDTLKARLLGRGSETPDSMRVRMHNAVCEIETGKGFHYTIVNDSLDKAVTDFEKIIDAEHQRSNHYLRLSDQLIARLTKEDTQL